MSSESTEISLLQQKQAEEAARARQEAAAAEAKKILDEQKAQEKKLSQLAKKREGLLQKLSTPLNSVNHLLSSISGYLEEIQSFYPKLAKDKDFMKQLKDGQTHLKDAMTCFKKTRSSAECLRTISDHQKDKELKIVLSSSSYSSSLEIAKPSLQPRTQILILQSPTQIEYEASFVRPFSFENVTATIRSIRINDPDQANLVKDTVKKFGILFNNLVYLLFKKNIEPTNSTIDEDLDGQCSFYWNAMLHHPSCNFSAIPMYLTLLKCLVTHDSLSLSFIHTDEVYNLFDSTNTPKKRESERRVHFHQYFWESIIDVAKTKGGDACLEVCDYQTFEECDKLYQIPSQSGHFYEAFCVKKTGDTQFNCDDDPFPSLASLVPPFVTPFCFDDTIPKSLRDFQNKGDVDENLINQTIAVFSIFFNNMIYLYDIIACLPMSLKALESTSLSSSVADLTARTTQVEKISADFVAALKSFRDQCSFYVRNMLENKLCDFQNLYVYMRLMDCLVLRTNSSVSTARAIGNNIKAKYALYNEGSSTNAAGLRWALFHNSFWEGIHEQSVRLCTRLGRQELHHTNLYNEVEMENLVLFDEFKTSVNAEGVTDVEFFKSVIGVSLSTVSLQQPMWNATFELPATTSAVVVDLSDDTRAEYEVSYSTKTISIISEIDETFKRILDRHFTNKLDHDWYTLCASVDCKNLRSSSKEATCQKCKKSQFCDTCHSKQTCICQSCNYANLVAAKEVNWWWWLQNDEVFSRAERFVYPDVEEEREEEKDNSWEDVKNAIVLDNHYPKSSNVIWRSLSVSQKQTISNQTLNHAVLFETERGNIRTCDAFSLMYPGQWLSSSTPENMFLILQESYDQYYFEKVKENVLNTSAEDKPPLPPKVLVGYL